MGEHAGSLSGKIREYFAAHPNAGPTEVAKALAEKKIKVSVTLVSNVKMRMARGKTGGRLGRPRLGSNGTVDVSDLLAAKKLVDHLGSIEAAADALNTLAKLK